MNIILFIIVINFSLLN